MRILHVMPTYLPATRYGGPIFAVHGLCRALAERGHVVEVATTNIDGLRNSDVPIGVPVTLDGINVRYYSSWFLRRLSWAPSLAPALRRNIGSFDVVHLHSVFLWPTWAAAHAAQTAGVPYVVSPRGMLVKELIEARHQFIKSAWIRLIERSNVEHAAAVHVTSKLEAEELTRFRWRLPQTVSIANGVDDPEIAGGAEASPDVRVLCGGEPVVLFLGRLSWKKGLDRLLHAFASTSGPRLVVAGTDDENLTPRLRALATRLGINDRVVFLPRTVAGIDKERLFAAARLFVLPSYSENFGNTVLEAMRRGVPVVVTPEVGAAEIVRDAAGGLVADGEAILLARAINRLASDEALARAMGQAGQRYVCEHYAWPRIAAQMEALYERIGNRH